MCTNDFIRMFTVDLYGNRGFDSRRELVDPSF